MPPQKNPLGPTGLAVAGNVRRLREDLGWSIAELARQLEQNGRRIPVLGLSQVERGERRVDADDLVALAAALGVAPITLLVPQLDHEDDRAAVTGADEVSGYHLWAWLTARTPIDLRVASDEFGTRADTDQLRRFDLRAVPAWARPVAAAAHPARSAVARLGHFVALALAPMTQANAGAMTVPAYREWIVTQLRRNVRDINDLADDLEADRVVPEPSPWAGHGDG